MHYTWQNTFYLRACMYADLSDFLPPLHLAKHSSLKSHSFPWEDPPLHLWQVTVVLLLIASPNLLCCGLLHWGPEKLKIPLPTIPCCPSSESDLHLPNRSSHERLQNCVGWREKQGGRPPFQRCRSQQRGCGSGVSSKNSSSQILAVVTAPLVVQFCVWLGELFMAAYSRICGFTTHSQSHLMLCNEYLSV